MYAAASLGERLDLNDYASRELVCRGNGLPPTVLEIFNHRAKVDVEHGGPNEFG